MQTVNFIKAVALGGVIVGSPVALGSNPSEQGSTELPSYGEQQRLSDKCNCSGASDCTCKKGQCKCPKCGKHNKVRMIETLKGQTTNPSLPDTARLDASAGVFI